MKTFNHLILATFLFVGLKSEACKCGKFNNPQEMYDKSELVFFGSLDLKSKKEIDISFMIDRIAKGDESKIGSRKIKIKWQNDENQMCRGFQTESAYLVFAVRNKEGFYSFLTDCYNEAISASGPNYVYKGHKYTDFDFFKVNTMSAVNGLSPLYADEMTEKQAKESALQKLWEEAEFKKKHLQEHDHWKPMSAKKMQDDRKQTYWAVTIGYLPQRAKGEFYIVSFYNTRSKSYRISPGE